MKRISNTACWKRSPVRGHWATTPWIALVVILLASGRSQPVAAQPPETAEFQPGQVAPGPLQPEPLIPGEPEQVPVDADTVRELLEPDGQSAPEPVEAAKPSGIDLLSLIARGGGFMIPIGLMSMLVVTLVVERMLKLRRNRLIPKRLVRELRELCDPVDRFNPTTALSICRQYPSAAATAIEAMLMRTGQTLAEIERAATETVQREADDHAAPIRWLSLSAAATPLMGLLGTVWGMIIAFHESTTLAPDRSRSEQLSEGIYTALVTTLAGLVVAIPAAIFAQYLENRLAKHFHRIERLAFELAPGLARFVGRARLESGGTLRSLNLGGQTEMSETSADSPPLGIPPVANTPVPAAPPPVAGKAKAKVKRVSG